MAQDIPMAQDSLGNALVKTARVFPWFAEVHIRIGPNAMHFSPGHTPVEVRCLSWAEGRCLAQKGRDTDLLTDLGDVVGRFIAPFLTEKACAVRAVAAALGCDPFLDLVLTPAVAGVTGRLALDLALSAARRKASTKSVEGAGKAIALARAPEEEHPGTATNRRGDQHVQADDDRGADSGDGTREGV